jgi:Na+-transporting NADH:ubiquinone oxidoreductase subunit A
LLDKTRPGLCLRATATGKVSRINLGARRFPERIEIAPGGEDRFAEVPRIDPDRLASVARTELIEALLATGLWSLIRQRPIGKIARPDAQPKAIYVGGLDTEPLAADPAVAVRGHGEAFQLGVDALRRLTEGPVYLTLRAGADHPAELRRARGVEVHEFAGPHPAGLVGTPLAHLAPLRADEVAWYLKAQEVVAIGEWLAAGRQPTHKTVAVAGTGALQRGYFRVRIGSALMTLTGGVPLQGDYRLINGTVLSGTASDPRGFLGWYAQTLTIIPEGTGRRDLFGWATPQVGRRSASRAVLSWLAPKREYDLDARLNGGPRHIVNIGAWESMTPLDIYPTFLVRAIQAGDLEQAIQLGLLEVTEEDVALCTYADPCKIEVGEIIRQGLDLFEKEG